MGNQLILQIHGVIVVDTDEQTITVRKRNWFLIGKHEHVIAFRFIRSIKIDDHLLGTDIHIKVIGGTSNACSIIYLNTMQENQDILIEYNEQKKEEVLFLLN